jgi:hypothetical protein
VLRSRPIRRANSLIDKPATKRIRRISAHRSTSTNDLPLARSTHERPRLQPRPDTTHQPARAVRIQPARGDEHSTGADTLNANATEVAELMAASRSELWRPALSLETSKAAQERPVPSDRNARTVSPRSPNFAGKVRGSRNVLEPRTPSCVFHWKVVPGAGSEDHRQLEPFPGDLGLVHTLVVARVAPTTSGGCVSARRAILFESRSGGPALSWGAFSGAAC